MIGTPRGALVRVSTFAFVGLAPWLVTACGDDFLVPPENTGGSGGAGGTGGSAVDEPPPPASTDWCERVLGGPSGTSELALDWSAAHGAVRYFGTNPSHEAVDEALSIALAGDDPWSAAALSTYAGGLADTCAISAVDSAIGPSSVEVISDVAIVRPGTGALTLPDGIVGAAIDLRGLPPSVELRAALDDATQLLLDAEVPRATIRLREHDGLTDAVFAPLNGGSNVYSDRVVDVPQVPFPGGAERSLPLVVLTDVLLAPEAAELAATLRLAGRAWLVGEDLPTSVAESSWYGVGELGIAHRDRVLLGAEPWPDVIPADLRTRKPAERAAEVLARGLPPALAPSTATRAPIEPLGDDLEIQADVQGIGEARAALLIAHGTARRFFPYFETVGDTIDDGLLTELDGLASSTETGWRFIWEPLVRLGVHLHDSHVFNLYLGDQPTGVLGWLPVLLDETATGEIVARHSTLADVLPGDRLVSIDTIPVADILAEMESTLPGSTPGARTRDGLSNLTGFRQDVTWELVDPLGTTKLVSLTSADASSYSNVPTVSARPAGFLTDLGHPTLYYINLDGPVFQGGSSDAINAAQGATGLILDGRGYPGSIATWDVIKRVLGEESSVHFVVPQVSALGTSQQESSQTWAPLSNPSFSGPVAVIIGPTSQSQAEHILMALRHTDGAQFVGRQTAGANGNITGVMLPGAMAMTFTGMEVLFEDGSTFHGVGIQPDVETYPNVPDLVAGLDPELQAAIAALGG